eukprot:7108052-Lingulodinium_polyedra.AAC.1
MSPRQDALHRLTFVLRKESHGPGLAASPCRRPRASRCQPCPQRARALAPATRPGGHGWPRAAP